MKLVYVAGPFRGKNAWEVKCNVHNAEKLALEIWGMGAAALCPHANTANFDGTLTDQLYLDGTMEMLKRCDAMVVVPDWKLSSGTGKEINEAYDLKIPVFFTIDAFKIWFNIQMRMNP